MLKVEHKMQHEQRHIGEDWNHMEKVKNKQQRKAMDLKLHTMTG